MAEEATGPRYRQIAERLRWQIAAGELRPGDALPATRVAAGQWGANRHTVARAYRELVKAIVSSSVYRRVR